VTSTLFFVGSYLPPRCFYPTILVETWFHTP